MDRVLETARPAFTADEIPSIAARWFGLAAEGAIDLGSERDQAFLLVGSADKPLAVLKVSNSAEDIAILDMEALAALHAASVDPSLPLALPRAVGKAAGDRSDAAAYRITLESDGRRHVARLYDVLPGRRRSDPHQLSDEALGAWGETAARVDLALRGFFHPRARRTMLWDVQHAAACRGFLGAIRDERHRRNVEHVLDRFEAVVAPAWPRLRAQVVHTDLTEDNLLVDADERITGIVDFGDMSYTALVTELSSVLDAIAADRGSDTFRVARLLIDGYERHIPLEPIERRLLGELWATRSAITIAISSWRAAEGLENRDFGERHNGPVAATLEVLLGLGWKEVARQLGGGEPLDDRADLIRRRVRVLGPALEPLSYDEPITMASASGIWMTDADGRRYLDAYNNVPCVGHAHPRVSEAIARQSRRLNTNLRYLHDGAITLAERLVATCPPGLDTVLFVNSGSEANDLAWRLATTYTGHTGGLCTRHAYHGVSVAIAALSPEMWPDGRTPDHVETWPAPDPYRSAAMDPGTFRAALERLVARGHAPAATILDGLLTSDGYPAVEPAYAQSLVDATRAAGGLWIADEVQGGHGRTGDSMWSFERFGIEPDIVTLGKPMGNGHPVGAVITRREIAQRFADDTTFFSTFAGNQVSVAAALAVLDVLDDERVLPRVVAAGHALQDGIWEAATGHDIVGDVRGVGLAIGVEIVADPVSREPAPALATAIQEGMRREGVLIGTTGAAGNVLKVRPPLAFTVDDVPPFTAAFTATLDAIERDRR